MKHSTGRPTKAERERMARLKEMMCVACRLDHVTHSQCGPTEVQHLLRGNKRRGHLYTIPLGAWHHRGIAKDDYLADNMEYLYGPSLALRSKKFHETYGSDNELLALTNEFLDRQNGEQNV